MNLKAKSEDFFLAADHPWCFYTTVKAFVQDYVLKDVCVADNLER